jgi:hypothetical protein
VGRPGVLSTLYGQIAVTAPANQARSDHWLRAIGYGLLAEIATIITIILVTVLYRFVFVRGLPDAQYAAFNDRVGEVVGIVGGTLFTFLFARRLMRYLSSRFIAHGVVLALVAVALSVGGSIAGHHDVPRAYMLASVLKLAAGVFAGSAYGRGLGRNQKVV